ncbi:hypothetical protein IMCC21224_1928 [Puniceibacterium sp. IMCC21224]|nr:hypothetical protein IMCC21224_1928 [Puniceibacterium sp. IMCC21224]
MIKRMNLPKIDLDGVGIRVEAVLVSSGLKDGEFAATVGIDPSSFSKIIQGKKPLNADMGFRISERWDVSMDYLYRGRLTGIPEKVTSALRNLENIGR